MNFTENIRYDYPLTPDSRVIDAGGYKGAFAREIDWRYNCWINVYEPVFAEECLAGLPRTRKIAFYDVGLAGSARRDRFCIKGDMTGAFAQGETKDVELVDVMDVVWGNIDLLKLNIEGLEFEVLERLLANPEALARIKNIQVQFHPIVHDAEARYQSIRERLLQHYELTYDFPWCWQNFKHL